MANYSPSPAGPGRGLVRAPHTREEGKQSERGHGGRRKPAHSVSMTAATPGLGSAHFKVCTSSFGVGACFWGLQLPISSGSPTSLRGYKAPHPGPQDQQGCTQEVQGWGWRLKAGCLPPEEPAPFRNAHQAHTRPDVSMRWHAHPDTRPSALLPTPHTRAGIHAFASHPRRLRERGGPLPNQRSPPLPPPPFSAASLCRERNTLRGC